MNWKIWQILYHTQIYSLQTVKPNISQTSTSHSPALGTPLSGRNEAHVEDSKRTLALTKPPTFSWSLWFMNVAPSAVLTTPDVFTLLLFQEVTH
nr:putative chronic lymphocytic leukemia up-regulated protein 1 opposite strand transcript protein isoform X2 [Aotus nancymaae]